MSNEKVHRGRATDIGNVTEIRGLNAWVPGTPAKFSPIRKSENESVLRFPEEKANSTGGEEQQSRRGFDIDLNKSIGEIDASEDVSFSDFNSKVVATPSIKTREQVVELNKGIDDREAQSTGTGIPSFNVASPEPVNSHKPRYLSSESEPVNSQEPEPVNLTTTQKGEAAEAVDSSDNIGNLFVLVDTPIGANAKECTTNSPESCLSQDVPQNVPADVISPTAVENLESPPEKKKPGRRQKPKRKRHRPKVLVEGKPKKTQQPKPPKTPKPPKKTLQPKTPKPAKETTRKRKRANESTKNTKQNSGKEECSLAADKVVEKSASRKRKCVKENGKINSDAIVPYISSRRPRRTLKAKRILNFDYEDNSSRATEALNFDKLSRVVLALKNEKLSRGKIRSKRRKRLNILFMRTPVGQILPKRMKRLRRATKRVNLTQLTDIPICSQLPNLSMKEKMMNVVERTEKLPELMDVIDSVGGTDVIDRFGAPKVEERTEMEPRLVDLELPAAPTFKYEDFLHLTGPLEVPSQEFFGALELFPEVEGKLFSEHRFPEVPGMEILSGRRLYPELLPAPELLQGHSLALDSQLLLEQTINSSQLFPQQMINPSVLLEQTINSPGLGMGSQILQERTINSIELGMCSQLLPHSLGQGMGIGMCEPTINPRGQCQLLPHSLGQGMGIGMCERLINPWGQGTGSLEEELLKEQIMCSLEHLQDQQMTSQQQKIDPVTDRKLTAESKASASHKEDNKALVVRDGGIRSGDGAMVPYHVPEKRKKRLTAKVYLDPETIRMWNLIMNIDDGTTTDDQKINEEKEKWWQTERQVFEGRIQSFTARMTLFLGDRRFKPWKGSVVDSVIGVYLTQNVSDNLSSSAYMSLAARFPIKSTSNHTVGNTVPRITTGSDLIHLDGNTYFVTEPEPDGSCELKDGMEPMDEPKETADELKDKMEAMDITKDTLSFGQFNGRIQLSSVENLKADVASVGRSNIASTKITHIKDTTSQQQDEERLEDVCAASTIMHNGNLHNTGDKILSCEECTRIDIGDQASTSGRNDLKSDCGSKSDIHDLFGLSISPLNQENSKSHDATTKGKGPNLKEPKLTKKTTPNKKKKKYDNREQQDWELLRRMYSSCTERSSDHMDSVDWEAVRCAEVDDIAEAIKDRGQQNIIAGRIKDFLNRLVKLHNCIDLEWLRNVPSDKVKEYLLEIQGLGLKSVECVRLLSLQHMAFPVDVNVGRIAVRLGWVPLEPLPGDVHLHHLDDYPLMDSIQKYLWPRLCCLDQRTLYELHYHMITFGKVFCTKKNPNCGACPLRGECKHFASAFASARLALPGISEKRMVNSESSYAFGENPPFAVNPIVSGNPYSVVNPMPVIPIESDPISKSDSQNRNCEPIIEVPQSPEPPEPEPEPEPEDFSIGDIEDIPTIRLQEREFKENVQSFMEMNKIMLQDSRDLVALTAEAASLPPRVLKDSRNLRTEHMVYVLPSNHELLQGFDRLEPDDLCPYLLAIWSPGETPESCKPPKNKCNFEDSKLCNEKTCYSCNNIREQDANIVRGTILIPCRTANRGRFPLNGTYFQVNEVFADHETSYHPINVPRSWIANLPTQMAHFGSSVTSIFKGVDLQKIQRCFHRGFICVRGFDRKYRAPRPLARRFHCTPSKMGKQNEDE